MFRHTRTEEFQIWQPQHHSQNFLFLHIESAPPPCTSISSEVHVHIPFTLSKQEAPNMPGFLSFGWRISGFRGRGVSQMTSETVRSFPIHRLPSQVGHGEWYLHWGRLPLLLPARQSGLADPRGPPIRHVCSSHKPPGNQSCFPAALPIRHSLGGPYGQLSAGRMAPLPFCFLSQGNRLWACCFFIIERNFFSFSSACVDSFPLLYPFKTIIENVVFSTNSPEGFLAVVSIYIILYFASSPLHLLTPQTPSSRLLRHQ